MARPARSAGNDAYLGRADSTSSILLQALHQGTALRRHLHQHEEDLPNAAGVRMLALKFSRGLALLMCACSLAQYSNAQQTPVECQFTYLATSEYVREQATNHQAWLEKWGLAVVKKPTWLEKWKLALFGEPQPAVPPDALGDHLRARFGCYDFSKDDLANGFASVDWRFAHFGSSNLSGADLTNATLTGANFENANLEYALLNNADMRWARIVGTKLGHAQLWKTKMAGAVFEPDLRSGLPKYIEGTGYSELVFKISSAAIAALREEYKKAGNRSVERQLTYAIESSNTSNAWNDDDYLTAVARYIGWKLPTDYELAPTRPLLILAAGILLFALPYYLSMRCLAKSKIWRVLSKERLGGDGAQVIERLQVRGWERVRYAFQFSVYSAFQLGWRDLNVGSWLSRLQSQEYLLRGSGWVRTLSGIQGLLSVYLLAMWALTQFGRLFEG